MTDDTLKRFRDQVPDPVNDEMIGGLEPPTLSAAASTESKPRLNRFAVGTVGASALVVVVVAALAGGGGGDTGAISIPPAFATASAAAAESSPEGYTRTKVLALGTTGSPPYSYYEPRIYETWVNDDGSGRLRTTELPVEWPGFRDQARAEAANDRTALDRATPNEPEVVQDETLSQGQLDQSFGGGSLPAAEGLSSDADELRDQLEAFVSGDAPKDVAVFELASGVLLKPNVDPAVRAAAFEVLGRLPGVAVDRSATDPLGRDTASASITSGYTGAESTRTLYFDPDSSRTFAFTDTLSGPEDFIDSRTLTSVVVTEERPSVP